MKIIVDRMPRTGGDCIFAKPAPFGLKYVCNITTDSNPRCKLDCEGACPYLTAKELVRILCISSLDLPYAMRVKSTNTEKKWRSSSL